MSAIKRYNIGKTRITLVWKYRYSKDRELLERFTDFRDWRIAIWFKKNKMVGKNNFSKPNEWKNNLVNDYMLGFDLLIFRGWINWNVGGMHLEIKE
jgi:hypothetical protein